MRKRKKFKKIPLKKRAGKKLRKETTNISKDQFNKIIKIKKLVIVSYLPQISRFFSAVLGKKYFKMIFAIVLPVFFVIQLTNTTHNKLSFEKSNYLEKKQTQDKFEKIEKKITFWETVIEEKDDYRDGYLMLALLNFKAGRKETAKDYWQKAYEIDPNNKEVNELKNILEKD